MAWLQQHVLVCVLVAVVLVSGGTLFAVALPQYHPSSTTVTVEMATQHQYRPADFKAQFAAQGITLRRVRVLSGITDYADTSGATARAASFTSTSGTPCAASRPFRGPRGPRRSAASTVTWLSRPVRDSLVAPGTQASTSATTSGSAGSTETRGSSPPCTASATRKRQRSSGESSASCGRSPHFRVRSAESETPVGKPTMSEAQA
jgi:hypothetical protein